MMRQRYDYSDLSWQTRNEPRYSHLKLLWGWVIYFLLYFLTENLIPPEKCHPVHCRLDDLIPFNEYFAIFYCGWFLLVAGSLLYYLLYDVKSFRKLQTFLMVTQAVAMACYIIYPTRQDLRPDHFDRNNLFTLVMGFIYAFDTSTGVCPSLHAAYSIGILSVGLKDKSMPVLGKLLLTGFVIMICLAVCFVKQHSAVDVIAALPVCLLAECLVYGKDFWMPKLKRADC